MLRNDDSDIVDLFLGRNENAITAIQNKYGLRLFSIANSMLKSSEDAEECVNDALMQAWMLIPPNEPRENLFLFMAKIVRHISIDKYRHNAALKRKAESVACFDELDEYLADIKSIDSEVSYRLLGKCISNFLRKQNSVSRDIFLRRYWYGESIEEIADFYFYSENRVAVNLFRTKEKLKKELKKEGFVL